MAVVKASPKARTKTKKIGFQDEEGNWHLMPEFKGQVLASCIYGVDIDAQAVEVTIMSLYLKMLEGRLPENWQSDFLQSRLLPSLDNNIRCGNSLISQTDFDRYWDEKFNDLFGGDEDVRFRINAFDWTSHTRGFGRILEEKKGFDCIIGNPPYIRVQELKKWSPEECEFYKTNCKAAAKGNYDIYVVFIEKGLQLLALGGLMGYICPHKFWQAKYGEGIRNIVVAGKYLQSVIDFTDQQVFKGATTYTAIHIFCKCENPRINYARINVLEDGVGICQALNNEKTPRDTELFEAMVPMKNDPWVFVNRAKDEWLRHMREQGRPLGEMTQRIAQGIVSGKDSVFIVEKIGNHWRNKLSAEECKIESELLHPLLKGSVHVKRWLPEKTKLYLLFPYEKVGDSWRLMPAKRLQAQYPKTYKYFEKHRDVLEHRERGRFAGEEFYQFSRPQNFEVMDQVKIVIPSIATRGEYAVDRNGEYFFVGSGGGGGGGYGIIPERGIDLFYLCGLLNSKLLDSFLKTITTRFHSGWYAYSKLYLEQIPIRIAETERDKGICTKISKRVQRILELKGKKMGASLGEREQERIEREIESYETQIDELVYELYGVDGLPE